MKSARHVCIAIPVYKAVLTPAEQFSLEFCRRGLAKYPLQFIAPQSFALSRPSYLHCDDEHQSASTRASKPFRSAEENLDL